MMRLSCPDFEPNTSIPSRYTCEGANGNPPLEFFDIPPQAKSLVLIVDDPDVPPQVRKERMYDHWVIYNIPPTTTHLKANTPPPGLEGLNTGGKVGYTGPCPPRAYAPTRHRYHFKLFALDQQLPLKLGATKGQVEEAMKGHILAEATLIGTYEKKFS